MMNKTSRLAAALICVMWTPLAASAEPPVRAEMTQTTSATTLWDEAQRLAYSGQHDAALATLERLVREHPSSPEAARAEALLRRVPSSRSPGQRDVASTGPSWGYSELLIGQSLHGLWLGGAIAIEDDVEGGVGALALFGGPLLGLGLSAALAPSDLSTPQATALNLGALVGGVHGLGWRDNTQRGATRLSIMLGAQLGGMAIGGGLAYALRPTSGDLALISSSSLWTGALYTLLMMDLGLLLGGVLAYYFEPTRQQMAIADAVGLLGGLTGVVITPLLVSDRDDDADYGRVLQRTVVVSAGLGLILGGVIAHHVGTSDADIPQVMLMPERGGASVGVMGRF